MYTGFREYFGTYRYIFLTPKIKNEVEVPPAECSELLCRRRQGSPGGQSATAQGCSNAGCPLLTWSTALCHINTDFSII